MATVDLIKGKTIEDARTLNDGDVFRLLEDIPAKKHHCIQLAVKTLQKALDEYIQRIRIDRESEANHDLIPWLDEPA